MILNRIFWSFLSASLTFANVNFPLKNFNNVSFNAPDNPEKEIIKELKTFKSENFQFDVKITGSKIRQTEIDNSDIDINLNLKNLSLSNIHDFAENKIMLKNTAQEHQKKINKNMKKHDFSKTKTFFSNFKTKIFDFLKQKFNLKNIKKDNKVIKFNYKNHDFDIAPTIAYKFYLSENLQNFKIGTSLICEHDQLLHLNFSDVMSQNFKTKNQKTGNKFIEDVKKIKVKKSQFNKQWPHKAISSYGLENFLYLVPDNYWTTVSPRKYNHINNFLIKKVQENFNSLLCGDNIIYLKSLMVKNHILDFLKFSNN